MPDLKNKFHIKEIREYYHYSHERDYTFPGHRHFETEINIILSGELEVTCGTGIYSAQKNEMILIPPSTFHCNRVIGNNPCEVIVIHFVEEIFVTETHFGIYKMDENSLAILRMFVSDMDLSAAKTDSSLISYNEMSHKLLEILVQYSSESKLIKHDARSELPTVYNRIIRYMLDKFPENITINDIAKECGVGKTTLKNSFSHYTGKGVISFYNELKLEHAKRLLDSGKTCSEVTEELMFSSQGYFTRCFKSFYGETPIKFKNRKKILR